MQYQSNQTNPQPTPEDTAQNASTPASQEAAKSQQKSEWKQKIQTLLKKCTIPFVIVGALFVIVGALFLIVGVPIIINELYKRPGYVTMWSAADMLGYYGILLGAFVGIGTLVITIEFTRHQIQRESYLQTKKDKWRNIRSVFSEGIDNINPLRPLLEISEKQFDLLWTMEQLQKYIYACESVIDKLNMHLNAEEDYPKVKRLIEIIIDNSIHYKNLTKKLYAEYVEQVKDNKTIELLKNLEDLNSGYLNGKMDDILLEIKKDVCERAMHSGEYIFSFAEYRKELLHEYETSYQDILRSVGLTFDMIEKDIQAEADTMLHFWRKH